MNSAVRINHDGIRTSLAKEAAKILVVLATVVEATITMATVEDSITIITIRIFTVEVAKDEGPAEDISIKSRAGAMV